MVGMTRRSGQTLTLGPGCRYVSSSAHTHFITIQWIFTALNVDAFVFQKGIVAHEFGHALGFHHEQTRPDRDNYVRILRQNINRRMLFNFQRYNWEMINAYDVPYDYESVMHYGQYVSALGISLNVGCSHKQVMIFDINIFMSIHLHLCSAMKIVSCNFIIHVQLS